MQNLIERLARTSAVVGGVVLTALVVLTCVSVLGRGLNSLGHSDFLTGISAEGAAALIAAGVGPVNGDFELVEAGIAFAIFAFLPICQLAGGHATVDVFTSAMPRRALRWLIAFWEGVLTAIILLITWRLGIGMSDKMGNGETTFLLEMPLWWAYAASFTAALIASVTAIYCAQARVQEALSGRDILRSPEDADA